MKNYYLRLHKNDFFDADNVCSDHFNRVDNSQLGHTDNGLAWELLPGRRYSNTYLENRKIRISNNGVSWSIGGAQIRPANLFTSEVVIASVEVGYAADSFGFGSSFTARGFVGKSIYTGIFFGENLNSGNYVFITSNDGGSTTVTSSIPHQEGDKLQIILSSGRAHYYVNGDHVFEGEDRTYGHDVSQANSFAGFQSIMAVGTTAVHWWDNFDLFIGDKNKTWITGTIDLYDTASEDSFLATPSYTNYSVTKSPGYGTDLLGDNTWTGLDYETASPATPTETGYVKNDRYVDESGRIDVLDFELDLGDYEGTTTVIPSLSVYTSPDPFTNVWPDDWATKQNIAENRSIAIFGSDRYIRFGIDFTTDLADLGDLDIDLYVRVRINAPVMVPFYEPTRTVLRKFPEWMDMREYSATPTVAIGEAGTPISITSTPTSVGGQVINAVAGEWLNALEQDLSYTALQKFITTADLNQPDWIYFASDIPDYVYRVEGDGVLLANTVDLKEFYAQSETDDAYWWDTDRDVLYVNKNYDSLTVNGTSYSLTPQHVWNWYDEFGLRLDLPRHFLEGNESYRHRILDIYQNRPGVGVEAFKLALRRELNIWLAEGATPYSDYSGATPEVLEIEDLEHATDFYAYDGLPKDKMRKLVEELAERYPTTWGYFRWNKAFWDIGGVAERPDDYGKGYDVLPYRFDASPSLPDDYLQSGVGDANDLYIHRPDEITGAREFNATLKLRGRYQTERTEYPEVTINGYIYGTADRTFYNNPTITPWVTIRVIDETGYTYYTEHQASLKKVDGFSGVSLDENGDYFINVFQEGITNPDFTWFDDWGYEYSVDGATPFTLNPYTITTLEVHLGRYDPSSGWYDFPTEDFDMWGTDDAADTINSLAGTPSALTLDPSVSPIIVLRSNEESSYVGRWQSEKQPFEIKLNGAAPQNGIKNVTMPIPNIVWDNFLTGTPNKKYVVELSSKNVAVTSGDTVLFDTETFGGWTYDINGDPTFLEDVYILINESTAWVDGIQEFDAGSTTEFVWQTGEAATPNYPISVPYWDLFEADATSVIYGVVDENGPWRNGYPAVHGNTNYNLTAVDVSRADFGIPDGLTYVPTWMGVEVDDDRVVAWLDTNVVRPAADHGSVDAAYPDNVIEEELNATTGAFSFSTFILRARLRPGLTPQWYPAMHSGYFYDRESEYYAYAHGATETATTRVVELEDVARQGAPIIVKTIQTAPATPYLYRQVAFSHATPIDGATIEQLTTTNTEVVNGTDTNVLYLGYENVYDVSVKRLDTNESVSAVTWSGTNEIETVENTDHEVEYEVTYTVAYSFYADNEFIADDGTQRTRLVFADQATPNSATPAEITYETSKFDPATPIDIPLHTFYTTIDEGYIFISHNEYTLNKVEVRLSPSKLVADGDDYLMVTLRSLDEHDNPKPNQSFHLDTSFGNFDNSAASPGTVLDVITDRDGFAVATLTSWPGTTSLTGTITITGGVNAAIDFQIDRVAQDTYRLTALPTSDAIVADGQSYVAVYGRLETDAYEPVPNAAIYYRRGRTMYDVFTKAYDTTYVGHDGATPRWPDDGLTYTDSDGRFVIGPFQSATPGEPGYWFLSAESWKDATPSATPGYDPVGDVVFWYEYPDLTYGVNEYNQLPLQPTQLATPWTYATPQSDTVVFPVTYDDATPEADATPTSLNWEPPLWYGIQKYIQYQQGLLGNTRGEVEYGATPYGHPEYREH